MAGEVIAVKQIEVPPDGIARCYWWRHLEDELGLLTGQPLDPDGWQLRTAGRSVFYELWDSAGRQDPAAGARGRPGCSPSKISRAHSI